MDYDITVYNRVEPNLTKVRVKFDQRICTELKRSGFYPANLTNAEQIDSYDRKTPEYNGKFMPAAMALANGLPEDGTNGVLSVDAISPMILEIRCNSDLVNIGRLDDQIGKLVWEVNQTGWPPSDPYASV
ncbi:MAG: hypothetical protein NTV39_01675 [Candidatus Saccharibacteria bacterium]|nr:hypothetical protein [Candidatus Saccharibacteria bacterium]